MAEILYGAPVAGNITAQLAARVRELAALGVRPCLAIVRLGERESDVAYERGAVKRCEKTGIAVRLFRLAQNAGQNELLDVIGEINRDSGIHGCLLFRPLPGHIDSRAVCEALAPEKDVDGITSRSLAGVFAGQGPGFAPCTARSCLEILDYYGIDPAGKRAVVLGRSLVIGRPVAMLLLARDATVTVCHSRTPDLPALCREADILVAAVGRAGTVRGGCFNPRQTVIDVGINSAAGGICGDVSFEEAMAAAAAVTPVPGGVGAVTTAVLCRNVAEAAARQSGVL